MKSIDTTILIHAPAKTVWSILLDFNSYSSWNPFITKIAFTDEEKQNLEVLISPPESSAMTFKPKVISHIENKEFSWLGKLGFKGLFDGLHSFHLRENEKGQTLFTHREKFNGILVPLFPKSFLNNTQKGFELMNEALKKRAEHLSILALNKN